MSVPLISGGDQHTYSVTLCCASHPTPGSSFNSHKRGGEAGFINITDGEGEAEEKHRPRDMQLGRTRDSNQAP